MVCSKEMREFMVCPPGVGHVLFIYQLLRSVTDKTHESKAWCHGGRLHANLGKISQSSLETRQSYAYCRPGVRRWCCLYGYKLATFCMVDESAYEHLFGLGSEVILKKVWVGAYYFKEEYG